MKYIIEGIATIRSANLYYFLIALAVYLLSILLYALRLKIVLKYIGIKISILDAIIAQFLTITVNNITPSAKTGGELARAAYVHAKTKASLANIITAIVFERISEAFPITALALIAFYAALISHRVSIYVIAAIMLPVLGIILGIKYWDKFMEYLLRKSEERGLTLINEEEELTSLKEMIKDYKLLLLAIGLSSCVWVLDVLRLYIIGLSVGWHAPLFKFMLLSVFYLIIGLFAITPGGLGIIGGGLTAVLVALGAPADKAIAITIIERLISYGIATLTGGIIATLSGGWQAWKLLRSRWRRTGSTQK